MSLAFASSDITTSNHPKICLVLSGGGAKCMAHLGILRALEEQQIKPDCIVGTSAGALIGGLYATGMPIDEIEKRIKDTNFGKILYEKPKREEKTQYIRDLEYKSSDILYMSISKDGSIELPKSVINSGKLEEALRNLFGQYPHDIDFDRLPIIFRIVATDLATGKKIVFSKGQIAHSLRASMAIPALISPIEVGDKLLSDGMISSNLPILVAKEMGAEHTIAVNVGTGLLPKEKIIDMVNVSEQILNFLVQQNVDNELKTLTKNDVYILVDTKDIGNLEFDRMDEAEQYGYDAIAKDKNIKYKISNLFTVSKKSNIQNTTRDINNKQSQVIKDVKIQSDNIEYTNILRNVISAKQGDIFTVSVINKDIKDLMDTNLLKSVTYETIKDNDGYILLYNVKSKDTSNNLFHGGLELASDEITNQDLTLYLSHRNSWMNKWGAEWRNYITIGNTSKLITELNQPIPNMEDWFIRPKIGIEYADNYAYLDGQSEIASEYKVNRQAISIMMGRSIDKIGEWSIGASWQRDELKENLSNPSLLILKEENKHLTLNGDIIIDQLNDIYIPTDGYYLHLYTNIAPYSEDSKQYIETGFLGIYAVKGDNQSLTFRAEAAGRNSDDSLYLSPFKLGGYHHLSGYERNQWIGNYLLFGSLTYSYMTPWKLLGKPLMTGVSLETGDVWDDWDEIKYNNMKYAASIFGAIQTPIGPAQLGIGLTEEGNGNIYFYLGRTFENKP